MEYTEAFKRQVEGLFEARLDIIQASGRKLTVWQEECLVEAIAAMAVGSWTLAQAYIARSGRTPRSRQVLAGVTVDNLKAALAESRARRPKPAPLSQPRW